MWAFSGLLFQGQVKPPVFIKWYFTIAYFPIEPSPLRKQLENILGKKTEEAGEGNYNTLSDRGLNSCYPQTLGRSVALEQYKAKFLPGRTYVLGPKNWRGLESNLNASTDSKTMEWSNSTRCQQCNRALSTWPLCYTGHFSLLHLMLNFYVGQVWRCKENWAPVWVTDRAQWLSFQHRCTCLRMTDSEGAEPVLGAVGLCPPWGHARIYILTRQIHWRHEGSECCLDYNEVLLYYRTAHQRNLLSHPRRKSF